MAACRSPALGSTSLDVLPNRSRFRGPFGSARSASPCINLLSGLVSLLVATPPSTALPSIHPKGATPFAFVALLPLLGLPLFTLQKFVLLLPFGDRSHQLLLGVV